jgi:hypothetical protein
MKNMPFLLVVSLLCGCAALRSPHKDFRNNCFGPHVYFLNAEDNRMAICLPGPISENRSVSLECECASGGISYKDKMRWPDPMYEVKWDTIPVQGPCNCTLFYLQYNGQLDKDVQRSVKFTRGFVTQEDQEGYVR